MPRARCGWPRAGACRPPVWARGGSRSPARSQGQTPHGWGPSARARRLRGRRVPGARRHVASPRRFTRLVGCTSRRMRPARVGRGPGRASPRSSASGVPGRALVVGPAVCGGTPCRGPCFPRGCRRRGAQGRRGHREGREGGGRGRAGRVSQGGGLGLARAGCPSSAGSPPCSARGCAVGEVVGAARRGAWCASHAVVAGYPRRGARHTVHGVAVRRHVGPADMAGGLAPRAVGAAASPRRLGGCRGSGPVPRREGEQAGGGAHGGAPSPAGP